MTNGEKLCIDFPNMRYTISEHRVITTIGVATSFDLDWWNTEYKEPTKNDLGVDCISRQSRPVIHANWLSGDCKGAHCSNCEEYTPFVYGAYNFCPNCGADMREVEE